MNQIQEASNRTISHFQELSCQCHTLAEQLAFDSGAGNVTAADLLADLRQIGANNAAALAAVEVIITGSTNDPWASTDGIRFTPLAKATDTVRTPSKKQTVLRMAAAGATNREIAAATGLHVATIARIRCRGYKTWPTPQSVTMAEVTRTVLERRAA